MPLPFINGEMYQLLTEEVIFGVMVGTGAVTLIVMLMFANRQKLRSPLFIVNCLNLVLLVIAGVLIVAHYAQVSLYGIGEFVDGAYAQYTITTLNFPDTFASVLSLMTYALIIVSLLLQIYAVFAAQPRTRKVVTVVLAIPATVSWCVGLAWNTFYLRVVWGQISYVTYGFIPPYYQLYIIHEAIQTALIGITCCVLIGKLFVAIRWRRQAGIRKFGVLHILLITFGQCLIIPRIFPLRLC